MFSPRFFGIKTASSSLIIFQEPNYQRRVLLVCAGAIEGYFEGKTIRKVHQEGLVPAWKCHGSPGISNPEESGLPGLPVSLSLTLFSGLCPSDYCLFPGKNNWNFAIFFPTRRSLLLRRLGWTYNFLNFSWETCKFRATGYEVYWASCGVCWINPEFGLYSLLPSWSG